MNCVAVLTPLFKDMHKMITTQLLFPVMRATYNRTAFKESEYSASATLDEDLRSVQLSQIRFTALRIEYFDLNPFYLFSIIYLSSL